MHYICPEFIPTVWYPDGSEVTLIEATDGGDFRLIVRMGSCQRVRIVSRETALTHRATRSSADIENARLEMRAEMLHEVRQRVPSAVAVDRRRQKRVPPIKRRATHFWP